MYMKKILAVLGFLLLPLSVFAVQITVPSAPGYGYTLMSNAQDTYNASNTPSFLGLFFGNATGTSATTTNLFSTTASSTNLFTTLFSGAGLTSCTGATSALTWASGIFGCHSIVAGSASSTILADNNSFSGNDVFTQLITGSISGNAGSATVLQNARTINGVSFNGSANIVVASTTLLSDNNGFSGGNTFINTTTTSATTTNFFSTTASSSKLFVAQGNGCVQITNGQLLSTGSNCGTGSGSVTSVADDGRATLTISPTTGVVLAGLNLANANTWSALQTFGNILVTGSSTLQNFTGLNSTTTSLDTKSLQVTDPTGGFAGLFDMSLQTADHVFTYPNKTGTLVELNGTQTFSGTQNFPSTVLNVTGLSNGCLTIASNLLVSSGAPCNTGTVTSVSGASGISGTVTTSGNLTLDQAFGQVNTAASTTYVNGITFGRSTTTAATTTNLFSTTASSTNLFSTTANFGALTINSITGTQCLHAVSGVVSGTGSDCGSGGSGSPYPFQLTGNATSSLTQFNGGLTAYASSTIGNGTQAGGLTIAGTATTTATSTVGRLVTNPYFQVGIDPSYGYLVNDRANFSGNLNDYSAVNNYNVSAGACATADLTNANNLNSTALNFGDFGHTSSGFTGIGCTNNPFTGFGANSTYLFDPSGNIDFALGSSVATTSFNWFAGGYAVTNEKMTLTDIGALGLGTTTPNPFGNFDVASTAPAIILSDTDGATNAKQLGLFYNNGTLNIGTTTDALTSSSSSVQITPGTVASYLESTSTDTARLGVQAVNTSNFLNFSSTAGTPVFTIDSNGNLVGKQATTTNLAITSITGSIQCVHAASDGALYGTGSDCGAGGGSAYPFGLTGNATSTLTQFNGGLTAYGTSTIGAGGATTGLTISGGATTTGTAYFAGSVGIGSSTPFKLLTVDGAQSGGIVDFEREIGASPAAGGYGTFNVGVKGTSISLLTGPTFSYSVAGQQIANIAGLTDTASNQGQLAFAVDTAGTANIAMTLRNVGLGIGTTTGVFPLESSSSAGPQLALDNTAGGTNGQHLVQDWTGTDLRTGTSSDTTFTSTSTAMDLNTLAVPSIGIGTSTATAQFTLGNYTQTNTIYAGASTTRFMWVGVTGSSTPAFVISSPNNNGNVGIGTSTPFATLSASGTVAFNGLTVSTAGTPLCILNTVVVSPGGTTCALSSQYIKHDIKPLTSTEATHDIDSLRAITYINNDDNTKHPGFVAEEVAKVDPLLAVYETATTTIDGHTFLPGDPLSVDYDKMSAVIVKYLQDETTKATHSAEDNWQWVAIAILALWNLHHHLRPKK